MSTNQGQAGMTFGQVIRQRRIELGLTQEELAERVGDNVRQADISRLERDYITMPRRSRLEALAQALDVTPGYLLMQSGWFHDGEKVHERVVADAPQPAATTVVPLRKAELVENTWVGEHAAAASTLQDAILRAQLVSSQTRSVLTESAYTVERAGQTRRRRGWR